MFNDIIGETHKAYLLDIYSNNQTVWIPKSQCHWGLRDNLFVEEWIIKEKKLIVKNLLKRPAYIEPKENQTAIDELMDE